MELGNVESWPIVLSFNPKRSKSKNTHTHIYIVIYVSFLVLLVKQHIDFRLMHVRSIRLLGQQQKITGSLTSEPVLWSVSV